MMLSIIRNILHKELGCDMNFLSIFHGEFEDILTKTGCKIYGCPNHSVKQINIQDNPNVHFCNENYSNIRFDVDIDGFIIHDIVHYELAKNICAKLHIPIMFIMHDKMPAHVKLEDQYIIDNHYNMQICVALSEEIAESWNLSNTIISNKENIEQWKQLLINLKKTPYLKKR